MTTPIKCEARLMGLSKTRRKDGDWFEAKFHIHPDDMTRLSALFLLPLGTACNLEISGADDETTTAEGQTETTSVNTEAPTVHSSPETERVKGGERARRAGILCNDPAFQNWLHESAEGDWGTDIDRTEYTARTIRVECGVDSRAELDHNKEAGWGWDQIERDYRAAMDGDTEAARIAQRDRI